MGVWNQQARSEGSGWSHRLEYTAHHQRLYKAIQWNTHHRSHVHKIRMVHARERFSTAHGINSYGSGFVFSQLYLILQHQQYQYQNQHLSSYYNTAVCVGHIQTPLTRITLWIWIRYGMRCSHEWNNCQQQQCQCVKGLKDLISVVNMPARYIFVYMEGFRNGMMGVELSVTADSCDTI